MNVRRLTPLINTLAIFTVGAAAEGGSRVMPLLWRHFRRARRETSAPRTSMALTARHSPVTVLLPGSLRATLSLPTPAIYSP
jgi:hypothetical protein